MRGGSASRPWRFIWARLRPTLEVETWRRSRQQDDQLVLAPAGELLAQGQHPPGPELETRWAGGGHGGGENAAPEGLSSGDHNGAANDRRSGGDSEMAAGASHVATAAVEIHPTQSDPGLPTQVRASLARTGKLSIMNRHYDTLYECH